MNDRFEMKYVVSEAVAADIMGMMTPHLVADRHNGSHPDGGYAIASLYLDTPDYLLCEGTIRGLKNRYKLRIRSYDDDPEGVVFLEIKRKVNKIILKSRARVPRRVAEAVVGLSATESYDSSWIASEFGPGAQEFLHLYESIHAAPVLHVRYRREAYESVYNDNVRVTLDRSLAYRRPRLNDLGTGGDWIEPGVRDVVLEIKYRDNMPGWAHRIVRMSELEATSFPKYVCCLQHLAPELRSDNWLEFDLGSNQAEMDFPRSSATGSWVGRERNPWTD